MSVDPRWVCKGCGGSRVQTYVEPCRRCDGMGVSVSAILAAGNADVEVIEIPDDEDV